MTSKEKLIALLELKEEDFNPKKISDKERLQALESAMLEMIIGGDVNV